MKKYVDLVLIIIWKNNLSFKFLKFKISRSELSYLEGHFIPNILEHKKSISFYFICFLSISMNEQKIE